jgi:uncharacterized phage protein gp47/JayE
MAEITDTGYVLKTENEFFEEEIALYQAIDANWNLDPSSPDGIKIASDAETLANLDEAAQKAYNSKDPNKAKGIDLDAIAAITGTERGQGSQGSAAVTITGTDSTVIPAGSLIKSTENDSLWSLDQEVAISGPTAATVTAVEFGAIPASIGTLTKIVEAISGWSGVTNDAPATTGTNPDTDAELRIERSKGVSLPGQNQVDSTYAAIARLSGVRRVEVFENDTAVPDANGLPGHSTAIVVDGGDNDEIATAIYSKRNPGPIQHQGANPVTVPVTSPVTGNQKDIKFNRPDYVDITLVYNIANDGTLPLSSIEQLIKDATIDYTNGELLDADCGFNQSGFGFGEDVHNGRFYTPANNVIGQYGDSYVTSITVNGGASVNITFDELARFTDPNITVNIT